MTELCPTLDVGTRIDFGDEGTGVITARDNNRVFLESSVHTGWVDEKWLLSLLTLIDDDENNLDRMVANVIEDMKGNR